MDDSRSQRLHMESVGTGLPIVLLHAFPLSSEMWKPNVSELARHFRVITIDFPGFGKSAPAGDVTTMDYMAECVRETLATLPEKKVFLGLSMGGYVLMRLLRLIPNQMRAAVFISTRAGSDSEEGRAKRFKNIELVEQEGLSALVERQLPALLAKTTLAAEPDQVDMVRKIALTSSVQGVCAALRGMAGRPDSSDILKQTDFPMLFISGREDAIIPSAEMNSLAAGYPKREFHIIERAGHLLNLEQPKQFIDILATFLKRRVL